MNFLKFFITRYFWANAGLALVVMITIAFASSLMLKSCTHHGEKIEIPDLTGLTIDKAAEILSQKNLRYQIIDTIYKEDMPKLSIIDQIPHAKAIVKRDRVIYLTLNATNIPTISVPDVTGKSLRIATTMLEGLGLKVGNITRKPSFDGDQVLSMEIAPGTPVIKGTAIPLVVAESGTDAEIEVPDLIGLTLKEATEQLESLSLTETHIYDDTVSDSTNATIYKIRPSIGKTVNSGSSISLYLK